MHTPVIVARTRITPESHARFGNFSGDLNPIHADRAAARLMQPGDLLAYGMDLVLWALEALAAAEHLCGSPARLRARFLKWVFLEDAIALSTAECTAGDVQTLHLAANDIPVATLELFFGEKLAADPGNATTLPSSRRMMPRELSLEQLQGLEGRAIASSSAEAAILYPALTGVLGGAAIAELATCSYLIGMEAPGLFSMSMRYDLQLTAAAKEQASQGLEYRVLAVDPRFRKVKIAVAGTHLAGTLEALVREA